MDELVGGEFHQRSTEFILQAIERLAQRGCDAVVLGCTELPLVIDAKISSLPVLDSTRLLAQAAVQRALVRS